MSHINYYEILGVSQTSTQKQIKDAATALFRATHPDVSASPATGSVFKLVVEARETLTNPVKRKEYDKKLADSASFQQGNRDSSVKTDDVPDVLTKDFSLTSMGYLANAWYVHNLISSHHANQVANSPRGGGVVTVDPITLISGVDHTEGSMRFIIEPGSSIGDRAKVYNNGVLETPVIGLCDKEGTFLYNGMAIAEVFVKHEDLVEGGMVSVDSDHKDIIAHIPPCSPPISLIPSDTNGVFVLVMDVRITKRWARDDMMNLVRNTMPQ